MSCFKFSALTVVVAVAVLAAATKGTEAQSSTPSCAAQLASCATVLNSTNPPSSCCVPLKDALTNQTACLCNLYKTPGLLASFGINVTQALLLPQHCNISGPALTACSKTSGPASPSSSEQTPATPGKNSNGVGMIALSGMSIILLFGTSMMLF
ncbi:Lipid transfer-like protein VAS [Camellia lanceoleosa]|uniref:Lipid transfer-like protein VAS n=1 Tax=Camellia lanceoleosa TaxID=1840588 RepID=A0ACC0FIJ3_9ERIC|nr:Lipid transfer-like protein VAS [Camellia lanceoleosa]